MSAEIQGARPRPWVRAFGGWRSRAGRRVTSATHYTQFAHSGLVPGESPDSRRRNCRGTLLSRRSDHGSALVRLYTPRERGVGPVADIECAIAPGNPSVGGRFLFSHHASNGGLPMMKTKLAITALAIAGLVGSTFTADAKSHKTHKSSMTTGANMKPNAKGVAANPSGQGNVGPARTTTTVQLPVES